MNVFSFYFLFRLQNKKKINYCIWWIFPSKLKCALEQTRKWVVWFDREKVIKNFLAEEAVDSFYIILPSKQKEINSIWRTFLAKLMSAKYCGVVIWQKNKRAPSLPIVWCSCILLIKISSLRLPVLRSECVPDMVLFPG